MLWEDYEEKFIKEAYKKNVKPDRVKELLIYANNLYTSGLPIIYDQTHLALLIGINDEYLHRMSNAPKGFYRTFYIDKQDGKKRRIDEPLPDLKQVQRWILEELLYNVPCSKFAKAYIPKMSIKDNTRFHKKQPVVLTLDISNFFRSIKSKRIYDLFYNLGYNKSVSYILSRLCCYNDSLPQGAPTSAYLSNLIMKDFDEAVRLFCENHQYRYTRYADDMTFSGKLNVGEVIDLIDYELEKLSMKRNAKKIHIMRKGKRQQVTGIVVNEKLQLNREYRMKIRQEVHYIKTHGLNSHLSTIGEQRSKYINHLMGKINYCLFINPRDEKMKEYLNILQAIR